MLLQFHSSMMINAWNAALYGLHVKYHGLKIFQTGSSVIPNFDRSLTVTVGTTRHNKITSTTINRVEI